MHFLDEHLDRVLGLNFESTSQMFGYNPQANYVQTPLG